MIRYTRKSDFRVTKGANVFVLDCRPYGSWLKHLFLHKKTIYCQRSNHSHDNGNYYKLVIPRALQTYKKANSFWVTNNRVAYG